MEGIYRYEGVDMLTLQAPAKINLTLEVLGERSDGFHEIRSVIQSISLCDRLHLRLSRDFEFRCSMRDWVAEESLVSRAARLLREVSGYAGGAVIDVDKNIPLVSGLGGDSSDAAAVLRGLNRLWGLGLSLPELTGLAVRLGSDVSFFLNGGTALVEGRGELVTPLPALARRWVVLAVPSVPRLPGKTKILYDSLGHRHYTDGGITERLAGVIKKGGEFTASLLFNTFENVASTIFPEVGVVRQRMEQAGAAGVHLAGSGPALFTLVEDRTEAAELYTRFRQQGLEAYLATTLGAIGSME